MMGVDLDTPLSEEQLAATIRSIARCVVRRRMETPVVLFLELHKPLAFIASQSILVGMPFLGPLLGPQRMADFSKLIRDRENVEKLIARIEEMAAERDALAAEAEPR